MIIHSKFKDYEVCLEKDLCFLNELVRGENTQYVIDRNIYKIYSKYLSNIPTERLFVIDATEENKIIDTALQICEEMTKLPAKRNVLLVSIGGGIIQDITGFVANILYRGIAWVFIPTTLLACCDSCIGGKTSLNYRKFKNLLGTFYPPDKIYVCPQFCKTLTDADFESGMGEVIKFNLMSGNEGYEKIKNNIDALLNRDILVLKDFIQSSLLYKKTFVEIDEFDRGERIKLNFAHTFGHAIETVTNYAIPHGTAVAIGMIMANHISVLRGYMTLNTAKAYEKLLMNVINIDINLKEYSLNEFLSAIKKDKKQTNNNLTAVLMVEEPRQLLIIHDMTIDELSKALTHFISIYY